MTTTTTCRVCGATEEPARDHTCPVCGADLPAAEAPEASTTDEAPEAPSFGADDAGVEEVGYPPASAAEPAAEVTEQVPPVTGAPQGEPSWPTEPAADAPPPPPASPHAPAPHTPVPPPPPSGGPGAVPGRPSPYDPSHPSGLSSSLRTYGMLTHLSAFAGAIVALAFVGPLIMWLIRRDEHPFLDHHGKEALNFNLSMLLYGVIGIVASVATIGIGLIVVVPAAVVFLVTWIVTTIIAAVKANNGEGYRYPLTIRFVGDDV